MTNISVRIYHYLSVLMPIKYFEIVWVLKILNTYIILLNYYENKPFHCNKAKLSQS